MASVQRALGLRRRFRYKVLPLVVAVIAYVPAIVFVGVAALVPDQIADEVVPLYGDYYGFVTAAILLFVAFVVPEVLCTDRQTGMLGLYLASPLTRDTYLAMKAAAVTSVLTVVTLGPPLLLLVGYSLLDQGPGWPRDGLRARRCGSWRPALVVAVWYTGHRPGGELADPAAGRGLRRHPAGDAGVGRGRRRAGRRGGDVAVAAPRRPLHPALRGRAPDLRRSRGVPGAAPPCRSSPTSSGAIVAHGRSSCGPATSA